MPIPAGPTTATISLDEVKDELRKSGSITVDDTKIQRFIDAAEAEYERLVGPLSGDVTQTFDGGTDCLILSSPYVDSLVSAAYTDGTTVDVADLQLDTTTGIVYWRYGTAGRFTSGRRNVTVTYTVATLPADHRETIIADVAGYFEVTQHSEGADQAGYPGQEGYAAPYAATPAVLFPRIQALSKSYPVVG